MINYLITWNQVTQDAWNDGNLALTAWGLGAQLLPFAGVALALAGLAFFAFKMWEDYAL
jgi:hypothetical protein